MKIDTIQPILGRLNSYKFLKVFKDLGITSGNFEPLASPLGYQAFKRINRQRRFYFGTNVVKIFKLDDSEIFEFVDSRL